MRNLCLPLSGVLVTVSALQLPKVKVRGLPTIERPRALLDIYFGQKQVAAKDVMIVFVNATEECLGQLYPTRTDRWSAVHIPRRTTELLYRSMALPYRHTVVVLCHTMPLRLSIDERPLFWRGLVHNRNRIQFLVFVRSKAPSKKLVARQFYSRLGCDLVFVWSGQKDRTETQVQRSISYDTLWFGSHVAKRLKPSKREVLRVVDTIPFIRLKALYYEEILIVEIETNLNRSFTIVVLGYWAVKGSFMLKVSNNHAIGPPITMERVSMYKVKDSSEFALLRAFKFDTWAITLLTICLLTAAIKIFARNTGYIQLLYEFIMSCVVAFEMKRDSRKHGGDTFVMVILMLLLIFAQWFIMPLYKNDMCAYIVAKEFVDPGHIYFMRPVPAPPWPQPYYYPLREVVDLWLEQNLSIDTNVRMTVQVYKKKSARVIKTLDVQLVVWAVQVGNDFRMVLDDQLHRLSQMEKIVLRTGLFAPMSAAFNPPVMAFKKVSRLRRYSGYLNAFITLVALEEWIFFGKILPGIYDNKDESLNSVFLNSLSDTDEVKMEHLKKFFKFLVWSCVVISGQFAVSVGMNYYAKRWSDLVGSALQRFGVLQQLAAEKRNNRIVPLIRDNQETHS